ncbi:MAG: hypothetical protein ACPL1K_07995 [Candidatus Kryptoniota bacterium]
MRPAHLLNWVASVNRRVTLSKGATAVLIVNDPRAGSNMANRHNHPPHMREYLDGQVVRLLAGPIRTPEPVRIEEA